MNITIIYPKNELCKLIITIFGFFGIDMSENKYLTNIKYYENTGLGEIIMSPEFGEYFVRFYEIKSNKEKEDMEKK